ncbi:MAG: sel1 repeat family protein [Bacteroidota bacterium]|nr:sel1 repeat family protein [Bacteroidota bacterium]
MKSPDKKLQRMRGGLLFFLALFFLFPRISGTIEAQEHPNSPVFKDYKPPSPTTLIKPSDLDYELWENFMLIRSANAGDAAAQHELGLRYFLGKGFPRDTVKAAYWIHKSAEQKFLIAQYNYGIFLNNGWGVEWNPFEAYDYFRLAARRGMAEAEFMSGIFFTDNLAVPRNLDSAYDWIKKSSIGGYEPAKEVLAQLEKRGVHEKSDSTSTGSKSLSDTIAPASSSRQLSSQKTAQTVLEPVLLDFNNNDTSSHVDDLTLLKEALREGSPEFRNALGMTNIFEDSSHIANGTQGDTDASLVTVVQRAADEGSPEAQTVLGRMYERGIGVRKNILHAAMEYISAIRLDSRRAPALLWRLIHKENFMDEVTAKALKNDPEAEYVLAGLAAIGFDYDLSGTQAFQLLQSAAGQNYLPAVVETGNCYFSGRWVTQDKKKAMSLWNYAASLGSEEARIRYAASSVVTSSGSDVDSLAITFLDSASQKGSVLAEVALAYCYETGSGVTKNSGEAVRLYRSAAQRGNESAYRSLERMYDAIRPKEKEFQVVEE